MSIKNKGKKETMLTEHFALSEFTRSVTGELLGIDNTPTEEQISNMKALCEKVLEPLRYRLGHAVRITSGFRCKFLNKAVKGAENSLHMQGLAADLYVRDVADAIKAVYVKGEVPKKREQRKDWSIGVYGDLSAAIEHLAE